jgi:feruloyl esterase
MRSFLLLVAAALATPAGAQPLAPLAPLVPNAAPARSCESLRALSLPNTTIDSAVVDAGICRVVAAVTHPPAGDRVTVWLALPMQGWNGRFQGMGGGGFSGGSAASTRAPAAARFAAGATDTGHPGASGSFALDADGRHAWTLIRDNAYLGVHEMTVTGKAVAEALYGAAPRRAYFNGCSTGGRQGQMEAQRYPADYDGILSGAPAINWTKLHVAQLWGTMVMLEAKHVVPPCKLAAATAAAVASCDALDGVKDGVLDDPTRCAWDPKALVGSAPGEGECGEFTAADADVVREIWAGPRRRDGSRLWYGLPRGADFGGLTQVSGTPPTVRPNPITLEWARYFLTQNPRWDAGALTRELYEQLWDQSVEEFSAVIATDSPDLSAFRDRGGKIVLWHGWADPLIYPQGTIDYYERVRRQLGGARGADGFVRLFLAPGVGHCAGGPGPQPTGAFDAVVRWVEEGRAPQTLTAARRDPGGQVVRTRPLCPYPSAARYRGSGSTDDAASFECRAP